MRQEHLLAAGMAFSAVRMAGWGLLEKPMHLECARAAIGAFRRCAEESPVGSMEALVALKRWAEELMYFEYEDPGGAQQQRRDIEAVNIVFAERLLAHFSDHPHAMSFLVRGFCLNGPLIGPWTAEFPDGAVYDSVYNIDTFHRVFHFRLPSAFRLFVRVGDYRAAREICVRYPTAFASPDLRGWYFAVEGFTDGVSPPESFRAAAEAFDEDTPERGMDAAGGWSSINRDLWAPYFRSRSSMARAVREPEQAEACISAAAGCMPPFRSYSHTIVHRYHLFVRALAGLLGLSHGLTPAEARADFEAEIRRFGNTDGDPVILEFLDHAHAGFEQLRADRRQGLTSVGRAMAALDRVPLLDKAELKAVGHAVDRRMIGIVEGPFRFCIHRDLESIKDEGMLRRILLRLFQNSVPRYAQVRHGPFEYGKDIAVAIEDGGELVLRMYQAKCGEIKKTDWNDIRPQLEEIFQVPLESFQIPAPIHRRIGILIWNAHASPHIEPIMKAWQNDQWTAFQRRYELMHLDDIVNYILDSHLVSAFREALAEEKGHGAL
jgi:hypothetical protein